MIAELGEFSPNMTWSRCWHIVRFFREGNAPILTAGQWIALQNEVVKASWAKRQVLMEQLYDHLTVRQRDSLFGDGRL